METKYFINKFAGKCSRCGSRVEQQQGLCFFTAGKWRAGCTACFPSESYALFSGQSKKAEAEAKVGAELEARRQALVAERKALIGKLGICLDSPFDTKTTQGSWTDDSEWKVPFNGDGTDEEFLKVFTTPRQSLYGALRASNGCRVREINREEGYVLLSESVSLCS